MILFGWSMEAANEGRRDNPDWKHFIFGCIAGIAPWIGIFSILLAYGAQPDLPDGASIPAFVYVIVATLFVSFNVFAITMVLQYRRIGRWRDYLVGEKTYMVMQPRREVGAGLAGLRRNVAPRMTATEPVLVTGERAATSAVGSSSASASSTCPFGPPGDGHSSSATAGPTSRPSRPTSSAPRRSGRPQGVRVAYDLVHSMAEGEAASRARSSRRCTFAESARPSGVERIVYLGGLGGEDDLLPNLASRQRPEASWSSTGRTSSSRGYGDRCRARPSCHGPGEAAAGDGHAPLDRDALAADRDRHVVAYLERARDVPSSESRTIVRSAGRRSPYREMMLRVASTCGRHPMIVSVPS